MSPLTIDARPLARPTTNILRNAATPAPAGGFWTRRLEQSPSATAAAICALVAAEQHIDDAPSSDASLSDSWSPGALFRGEFTQLVVDNLRWLASRQLDDGGWERHADAPSSLTAALLVESAFRLTGVPARAIGLMDSAASFIRRSGGVDEFRRRHGRDDALVASVLACRASAGLLPWRRVPALTWRQVATLVGIDGGLTAGLGDPPAPALASGLARFRQAPPRNPVKRLLTSHAQRRILATLEGRQGINGGFDESILQTSFVVLGLAAAGLHEHSVVRNGVGFLLANAAPQGGWPSQRITE